MADYRVAVIGRSGKGNYGHGLSTVWLDDPRTEIVAVADDSKPGLEKMAKLLEVDKSYVDYRRMLDEVQPDIVAICQRWVDMHCEMVVEAANRGIHIYMEKPMCRNLEEADQMVAACQKNNVRLVIAHQTRFSPNVKILQDLLANELGELLEIRARGKEDRRGGGEDLWVLGTHLMDLARAVLQEDPISCFAQVLQDGHPITQADVAEGAEGLGPLAGDAIHAMYRFPSAPMYFESVRNAGGNPSRFGLTFRGSRGVAEVRTGYLQPVLYLNDRSWSPGRSGATWTNVSSAGIGKPEPLDTNTEHGNLKAIDELIAAIEEKREPNGGVLDARAATEMVLAVFESHRQGGPVSFLLKSRKHPLELL